MFGKDLSDQEVARMTAIIEKREGTSALRIGPSATAFGEMKQHSKRSVLRSGRSPANVAID